MTATSEDVKHKSQSSDTVADNQSAAPVANATVYVYGYGPTKNPFYEEARALNATPEGALLLLNGSVRPGQKLLLMNGSGQSPVEAQVVRTRTLDAQMFEAQIAFLVPQPDFWNPFRKSTKNFGREKRRSPRISLPRGMTISWAGPYRHDISRVSSLSAGGLFIEAEDPAPAGQTLQVQFEIPTGPVFGKAVVRRSVKGRGMGVEFTELPEDSRVGLNDLVKKLLGDRRNRKEW